MPLTSTHATAIEPRVLRLVDFAEPRPQDVCLEIRFGSGPDDSPIASALRPLVHEVTQAEATALPSARFTLITACLAPAPAIEPEDVLPRALAICDARLIVSDVVRTRAGDSGPVERVRDPARSATRSLDDLVGLVERAGGRVRRIDAFAIERPLLPWLAGAAAPAGIVRALTDELDGGPKTGTRPRLIGGELWFTQSWAYVAAEPAARASRRRFHRAEERPGRWSGRRSGR